MTILDVTGRVLVYRFSMVRLRKIPSNKIDYKIEQYFYQDGSNNDPQGMSITENTT